MNNEVVVPTVFATSGFVIPLTPYHCPYSEIAGLKETLFSKVFASTSDQMTREYFKNSNIYISETAKKLYDDYVGNPCLDTFIAVVDMVTDILKSTTPSQFFQWQVGSKHISNTSLMFCKDVITGKFLENYNTYNVLSFSARFTISNNVTSYEAADHWRDIQKHLNNAAGRGESWVQMLAPLMNNRPAFMAFFKHVFVDYY